MFSGSPFLSPPFMGKSPYPSPPAGETPWAAWTSAKVNSIPIPAPVSNYLAPAWDTNPPPQVAEAIETPWAAWTKMKAASIPIPAASPPAETPWAAWTKMKAASIPIPVASSAPVGETPWAAWTKTKTASITIPAANLAAPSAWNAPSVQAPITPTKISPIAPGAPLKMSPAHPSSKSGVSNEVPSLPAAKTELDESDLQTLSATDLQTLDSALEQLFYKWVEQNHNISMNTQSNIDPYHWIHSLTLKPDLESKTETKEKDEKNTSDEDITVNGDAVASVENSDSTIEDSGASGNTETIADITPEETMWLKKLVAAVQKIADNFNDTNGEKPTKEEKRALLPIPSKGAGAQKLDGLSSFFAGQEGAPASPTPTDFSDVADPNYWAAKKAMFISKLFAALANVVENGTTTENPVKQELAKQADQTILSASARSAKSVEQEYSNSVINISSQILRKRRLHS